MAELGTATDTVTTTSSEIVPANGARGLLIITNDSDTKIYLSLGDPAVLASGIPLAVGASFEMDRADHSHRFHIGAVNAIHGGTGSKVVAIEERDV